MNQNQTKETLQNDHKALEAVVIDNPDLERLEMLLDQFNMFESIGAVWQESRHSDTLAFLLNPQQNHGLGDAFAKRFLQKALTFAYDVKVPITPIDFDVWELDQIVVLRESQRMDILLLDERHKLAAIIENKLSGIASASQLQIYWETVKKLYPEWDIIGIYLTPDGEPPPFPKYIPVDYNVVCTLIEKLIDSRASKLSHDVGIMLAHYTEMLRRHIVGESEITKLCRRIYARHQRAFDMIYEHRLSRQKVIRNVTKLLIEQRQGLILDHSQERYTGFAVQEWEVPTLLDSKTESRTGRVLIFEFDTWLDTLPLTLYIGPTNEKHRQKLLDLAKSNQPPFQVAEVLSPTSHWVSIFERTFLTPEHYENASSDELADRIVQNWTEFLKNDLPTMNAVLKKHKLIE